MSDPAEPPGMVDLVVEGEPVLRYLPSQRDRPVAELVRLRVPLAAALPLVLRELSGWYLTSDDEALTEALLASGATVARHAHIYAFDLVDGWARVDPAWLTPKLPEGMQVTPLDRPLVDLAAVEVAAYPAGHPDHEAKDAAEALALLESIVDGGAAGAAVPEASGLVVDGDRVVAFLLASRMDGDPPWGGPWLSDVARDPGTRYRGVGSALIRRALAVLHAAGEPAFGLAVTEGNPAREVYERLGFRQVSSARRLLLPS